MKRRQPVPRGKRLTAQRIVNVLGRELAILLLSEWGGHRLPKKLHVKRLERDKRIIAQLDDHYSGIEVGRAESLTPQRVYQIGKAG